MKCPGLGMKCWVSSQSEFRAPEGRHSPENVSWIIIDTHSLQEREKLLLKGSFLVMLRLVANICNDLVAMRHADAERSKSFRPCKTTALLSEPFRGTALDLLKHSRNRNRARLGNQHMNVIWHAANSHGVDSEISRNSSHVLPEFFLLIGRNDFAAF